MAALVVTNPFGGYATGDRITDPREIRDVLEGEHANHVVRAGDETIPESEPNTTKEA